MIRTVKGFGVVSEAEVGVFLVFSCFFMIQWMLAIWSPVLLPFLNPACTSGSCWCTYYWGLAWRILSITLLACEMGNVVWSFVHSLALHFFGIEMKTDRFQSYGHCWVFQICWPIECSTLTASSFSLLAWCPPRGKFNFWVALPLKIQGKNRANKNLIKMRN